MHANIIFKTPEVDLLEPLRSDLEMGLLRAIADQLPTGRCAEGPDPGAHACLYYVVSRSIQSFITLTPCVSRVHTIN